MTSVTIYGKGSNISAGKMASNTTSFSELANQILIMHKPLANSLTVNTRKRTTELSIIEEYSCIGEIYDDNSISGNTTKKLSKIERQQEAAFNINDQDEVNSESEGEEEDWDVRNDDLQFEERNNSHMNSEDNEEVEEEIMNITNKNFEGQFNIINEIFKKIKNNELLLNNQFEDTTPLTKSNYSTKGELSKSLKQLFAENRIHKNIMDPLLAVLYKHIPEVNWPINDNKKTIKNSIYTKQNDNRMLEFHVCPDEACCAFVGNYSNHIICPHCKALRFTKCSHKDCRFKNYESCTHSIHNRVSQKSLFFRPVTILIYTLLKTKGFLTALKCTFREKTENYKYIDLQDGSTYKTNLKEMVARYNENFNSLSKDRRPHMINLLLGQFFDGCQIYKKKYSVFWPLNFIILNLPPNYRIKLGAGMFNLSIYTSKCKSNVEDFFLRNLAVGELKELEKGIQMCLGGVEYFIQARMILTILDTIGLEDYLKVQTNQSIAGCFVCNHGEGYNYLLDRIVYIGHRNLVGLRHYTRNFGVTKKCCPENYYTHSTQKFREDFEVFNHSKITITKKKNFLNNMLIPHGNKFYICDNKNTENVRDFLLDADSRWDWYHDEPQFEMHIFEKDLYFHNCDYRPFKSHKRISTAEYIQCGNIVKAKVAENPNLKMKFRVYKGIKGKWPLTELSYSKVKVETDINWGPMNTLGNVCLNLILNWKGERINTKISGGKGKIIEYCQLTGTHPDLYTGTEEGDKFKLDVKIFKWQITKDLQNKVFFVYLIFILQN